MKPYEMTPKVKAKLAPWHFEWLRKATNCDAMKDEDRAITVAAIEGLYRAANLTPPPRERIVFVPSPIVAANAGGFAAAIWHMRKDATLARAILGSAATMAATWAATRDATRAATRAATLDATMAATMAATWDATVAATVAATWDATWDATLAATRDATWAATRDATWDATWAATRDATWDATWDATLAATGAATRAATVAATVDATEDATEDATVAATVAATRDATWAATRDATMAATWDATVAATVAATWDATWDATLAATGAATRAATWAATWAATVAATEDATEDATEAATRAATEVATWAATWAAGSRLSPLAKWMLDCANNAHRMWEYGGEWTGYTEWIEFLRHVAGYERDKRVDYAKWQPYCDLVLHSGVRIMHAEFCIVSDRPESIKIETVNGRGRLHCADGPAKRYRDGWSIYAIHGVRVPAQVVMAPETLTVEQIKAEQNAEVRRIMIDRFGAAKYLRAIGAKVVSSAKDQHGFAWRLLSADVGDVEPLTMVEVVNPTPEPIEYQPDEGAAGVWVGSRWHKIYTLRVPPSMRTPREAIAWTFETTPKNYAPLVET